MHRCVDERAAAVPRGRMHHHACRLVHNGDVIVLENDLDGGLLVLLLVVPEACQPQDPQQLQITLLLLLQAMIPTPRSGRGSKSKKSSIVSPAWRPGMEIYQSSNMHEAKDANLLEALAKLRQPMVISTF